MTRGTDCPKKETPLARSSYTFEKRKKELARKKKNEEKLARKRAKKESPTPEGPDAPGGEQEAPGCEQEAPGCEQEAPGCEQEAAGGEQEAPPSSPAIDTPMP
jgi:hypothetical protein